MDERLVGHFDWTKGVPDRTNLCTYAVLLARIDRSQPTTTAEDEIINPYLGHVLSAAFRPRMREEVLRGDYLQVVNLLSEPGRPEHRWHLGQMIGDTLLFYASQHSRLGRASTYSISQKSMVGLGRMAYRVAAANTRPSRNQDLHEVFACLARDWEAKESLLAKAGDILGFDDALPGLVASGRLVATIEDVLAAIATFSKDPTAKNWDLMADVVHRREWTDLGFRYHLPLRPDA